MKKMKGEFTEAFNHIFTFFLVQAGILTIILAAGLVIVLVPLHFLGILRPTQKAADRNARVVVIYGCEYLYFTDGSDSITHKGNCTNHIHNHNNLQVAP